MNLLLLHEAADGADTLRLADALRERGHDVVVLCRPGGLARLPAGMRAVAQACREHAIELVNAWGARMTLVAGLARRFGRIRAPLVATLPAGVDVTRQRGARFALQRLADERVFASRFERDRVSERWGVTTGQVIHPGVEVPRAGTVEPIDLESKHGLPAEARVIGYVGELGPDKAVGDAIASLVRLPEDVFLCVVGQGPEEGALRAEARRRGVERRVVFAGASDESARYLASFAALVLPSHDEGLPTVLFRASALAVPVIAADVGAVREIVDPRTTGLLHPSGDVDGLVRAIRGILDDPSRAAALGCAARERVVREFGLRRFVDETEALFAQLRGR